MAQNINLLERNQAREPAGRVVLRRALIAVALVAAVTGTAAGIEWRILENARTELASERAQTQRLQREQGEAAAPDPLIAAQMAREERDVAALELIAQQLTNGSVGRTQGFTGELRAFGRATAAGIWLTGLRLDNANNSMALDGKAVDASRVPALIHALESEPYFSGTRFASIELRSNEAEQNGLPRTIAFRIATPGSELADDAAKGAKSESAAMAAAEVHR